MARNSMELLGSDYDLEPRGFAVFCTSLRRNPPSINKCGDLIGLLYRCTNVQ